LAQFAEGGSVVAGIALEAFLGTGADCDKMTKIGDPIDQGCHDRATLFGDLGVAFMLAGMLGFVATISTAEDEPTAPKIDIKAAEAPATAKDLHLPPGVKPQPVATPPAEPATTPTAGSDAPAAETSN